MMRICRYSTVVLLSSLIALSVTSAAQAANDDGNSTCVVGDYCAWTGTSFSGSVWSWFGQDNDWPAIIDEDESSVWNRSTTGKSVRVYDFTGFGTFIYCTAPNTSFGTLGVANDGNSNTWNNVCLP
jgi:hypothetical protein